MPPLLGRPAAEAQAYLANADVLHLHGAWDVPGSPSLAREARRLRLPYIVSTHGQLSEWELSQKWLKKKLYLALFGRRHLSRAAAVHCTAEAELAQASRFLPPGRGKIVSLPIDLSAFVELPGPELALRAFPQIDTNKPRVLLLSRLHPMKRPDLLIEAMARLKQAGQAFQLILAGPGKTEYVAYLHDLVRRLGLEDCVLFTGMVTGSTKISLYQAATVFALPTWMENFGYVLFEALAAGTPVITTRRADMWQELQNAGVGIVDPDPDAIASSIRSLLTDPAGARQLGQKGRAWVFQKFESDRVFAEFEQLYRSVSLSKNN